MRTIVLFLFLLIPLFNLPGVPLDKETCLQILGATISEPVPNVYLLEFQEDRNRHNVDRTMVRFQEYYEAQNPEFRGKTFTFLEYMNWYAKQNGDGNRFKYYEDFAGYNFPSSALEPFYQADALDKLVTELRKTGYGAEANRLITENQNKFYPLSEREELLLQIFREKKGSFYVIGTYKPENGQILNHEIAHGLFYTNKNYHDAVMDTLFRIREHYKPIFDVLIGMGYPDDRDILLDEMHAFLLDGGDLLTSEKLNPRLESLEPYRQTIEILRSLFPNYRYTAQKPLSLNQ